MNHIGGLKIMKLRDKFYLLKKLNNNSVIILKSGSFYATFDNDATILNDIFSYQIVNGKIGFPLASRDKVIQELQNRSINYIIYEGEDSEVVKVENDTNQYWKYFEQAKKLEYKNALSDMLLERIRFLIQENEENYDKIRRFIDEL